MKKPIIAFDTETTGAFPLADEVVEFGAVKFVDGAVVDELQILVKPSRLMSDFIIGIHGITNEMVAEAPLMETQIHRIRDFMDGSILMAHHAPFDLGFMAVEFDKYDVTFPENDLLCTSLLARQLILETANHKLQTLVKFLNIDGGQAHRALDDAKACLQVGLECWRRFGIDRPVEDLAKVMRKKLLWSNYQLLKNPSNLIQGLARAIHENRDFEIVYEGGSLRGSPRRITPKGLVRNPDGDYVSGICHIDRAQKRFYLDKISSFSLL